MNVWGIDKITLIGTRELQELRELNAELVAALKLIYDNSMDEQAMLIAGRAMAKAEALK